ncbi:MAG: TlpA family protein disulfide reductase [Mucilaginibacter sp.]|nr:TlpA family protein disulfide reductase [Mucilaginibacter sp.]
MRKVLFLIIACLNIQGVFAQKTITAPRVGASNVSELSIEKVLLSDTSTLLFFKSTYPTNTWFRISSGSYISTKSGEKLAARSITGIPFDKEYYTKKEGSYFTIAFPPVNSKTALLDYFEGTCDGCFKILDIELAPSTQKTKLPPGLYANWLKTDGSNEWVLGLEAKKAIYQNQFWDYQVVTTQQNIYKLTLKQGKKLLLLNVQLTNDGRLIAWENDKTKQVLANKITEKAFVRENDQPFTTPIVKNGISVLTGYINNYSPRLGFKTGSVAVNNVISGKQENYLVEIAPDGMFKSEIPMLYPEECFLEIGDYFATVFLSPDKKMLEYIDLSKGEKANVYMGDYAYVNRELDMVKPFKERNFNEIKKKSLVLKPLEYQAYITGQRNKNLATLNRLIDEHKISLKSYQVAGMNVNYTAAIDILEYNSDRDRAYRDAHHVSNDQEKTIPEIMLDSVYLSFVKGYPVNDETSVLSENYDTFINRIKYVDAASQYHNLKLIKFFIGAFKDTPPANYEEKEILNALTNGLISNNGDVLEDIFKLHGKAFDQLQENRKEYFKSAPKDASEPRSATLKRILGNNVDFTIDVINVQDHALMMAAFLKPFDKVKLEELKGQLANLPVYNAFVNFNDGVKQKIETNNKIKTGYVLNKVPKTTADSVFNAILKKYRGKVVYVDFWATWCSPCRSGIEEVAPLKKEIKDKNIAFIYITDPSSPEDTYRKMIPAIAGEHYKLGKDDWNYIATKYSISGIPRYMLVDKQGRIVNDNFSHAGNADLKQTLLKMAEE